LKFENERQLFLEVLDVLIHSGQETGRLAMEKDKNILQLREETIHSMACKMAVKANYLLNEPEIRELLKKLDELDNPFTCPHGRPVAIKLSRYELEKRFKRIV
jgi:DNA mismatch repair protein MutL